MGAREALNRDLNGKEKIIIPGNGMNSVESVDELIMFLEYETGYCYYSFFWVSWVSI